MNLVGCEDVWIETKLNHKTTLTIGSVYTNPKPNLKEFSAAFKSNLLQLKANKGLVVLGQ